MDYQRLEMNRKDLDSDINTMTDQIQMANIEMFKAREYLKFRLEGGNFDAPAG